ncbi:MAG: hypothetical protein F6J87_26310 [Spirulina sp. SIO3F2]|nr:hypothetical protein [Spirulina sp. SIO3F2]
MKRAIAAILSLTLLTGLFAPLASAQIRPRYQPSAFVLAHHAYGGTFIEQGIPSYGKLLTLVRQGQIDAADVVAAAIAADRLSTNAQTDATLLHALQIQLESLAQQEAD